MRQWKCREGRVHCCGSGNVEKEEFTVAAVEMSRRKSSLLRQWKCREGRVNCCGSGNVDKEELTVAAVEMSTRKSSLLRQWKCQEGRVHCCGSEVVKDLQERKSLLEQCWARYFKNVISYSYFSQIVIELLVCICACV